MTTKSSSRARSEPGTKGTGDYYRITLKPSEQFTTFRNQDVGEPGGLQRVAGKHKSGDWDTQAWLVSKKLAHVNKQGRLIATHKDAKDLFKDLDGKITHEKGDIFTLK